MYKFTDEMGCEYCIRYQHRGGRKEDKENGIKSKPPTETVCIITRDDGEVVARGISRPIKQDEFRAPTHIPRDKLQDYYGKQYIRSKYGECGILYVVLKGDMFSRKKGRKYSLTNAFKNLEDARSAYAFSKESKARAFEAIFENITERTFPVILEEADLAIGPPDMVIAPPGLVEALGGTEVLTFEATLSSSDDDSMPAEIETVMDAILETDSPTENGPYDILENGIAQVEPEKPEDKKLLPRFWDRCGKSMD